jgi:GT2 family glycosyltransferase
MGTLLLTSRVKISVVMPAYNVEAFVEEAIASVLAQEADELLIVNDGSTDRTAAILDKWIQRDARVRVMPSPRNEGIAAALRKGIEAARGEYVALHDADDVSLPGRLSRSAAALDASPDVVLVAVWAETIDGKPLQARLRASTPEVLAYLLHFSNAIGGSSRVMLRRDALLAAGVGSTELSVDYDLWTRLLPFGKVMLLPFTGVRYRLHAGGVSARRAEAQQRDAHAISARMLSSLLERELSEAERTSVAAMWNAIPRPRAASIAERVLREAFAHFDGNRRAVCRETARRWRRVALRLGARGHLAEALRCLAYAIRWRIV